MKKGKLLTHLLSQEHEKAFEEGKKISTPTNY